MREEERKLREKFGESEKGNFYPYDDIVSPHPYCITSAHITKSDSPFLDEHSIARAEERGARCGMKGCHLKYSEHLKGLLIMCKVDMNNDEEAMEEIKAYGQKIAPLLEAEGYKGIAFAKGWLGD